MSNAVVTGVTPVESENNLTDAKQVCGLIWRLIDNPRCSGGPEGPTWDPLTLQVLYLHFPEFNLEIGVERFLRPGDDNWF